MRLLSLILLFSLSACAFLNPEENLTPAPRPASAAAPRPAPKPVKKQFGAIWSEDSTWNDIYSQSAGRQIGDMVVVKLDDIVKHTIIERYDQMVPITEEVTPTNNEEENADKTPAEKAKIAAAAKAEKQRENTSPKTVRAFIREVRPRGMYVISGTETVRFGNRTPKVAIEGTIRDRDIDTADMCVSDQILNMRLDVTPTPDPTKEGNRTADANEGERT